ncbi:MAG: GNAT family N-acetyltransferase, partial [Gemmatimonadota bacterium]|nr:GNAT family N-acetyltransferase [Gemmatimonadota bacterium]
MIEGAFDQPVIRTERLILRTPEARDAVQMQLLAADRRVAEMTLNIPHPYPDGAAEQWLQQRREASHDGTAATFAIALPTG